MGQLHLIYLDSEGVYICTSCQVHLTRVDELYSKDFQGSHGKAYLFVKVINILEGPLEDRVLNSGLHTVCDIFCGNCRIKLGWKYERAYNPENKYKEGKIILERIRIKKTVIV